MHFLRRLSRKKQSKTIVFLGLLLGLPLILIIVYQQTSLRSKAAGAVEVESEIAVPSGNISRVTDTSAAGGQYVLFGSTQNSPTATITQPTSPPTLTPAPTSTTGTVDATSMDRKFMLGYQGWHQTPCDGSASPAWRHWFSGTPPTGPLIDAWPDTTELTTAERCDTGLKLGNGQTAYLFSDFNATTVLRHFQWMQQNNMDGVWLQRFSSELSSSAMFAERNKVALNVKAGAESTGRVFGIMYDISGQNASTLVSTLENDWKYMVDTLKVTQSSRYIKQNGLPVVTIWGFGFSDRPGTPSDLNTILNFFHNNTNPAYRAYVMGGVNNDWRTNSTWASSLKGFDAISPWMVGRINSPTSADNYKSIWSAEIAQAKTNGQMYVPVIFPGFSFHNQDGSTLNKIPRLGGNFVWRQAYDLLSLGATTLYGAMFDEVNEGTAFFKMAPTSATAPTVLPFVFVNADGYTQLPSDWYLRVAGDITKMVKGQGPLTATMYSTPH